MDTREKLNNIITVVGENFYGERKPVELIFASLLSEENIMLYGQKGTGKTTLAINVISALYSFPTKFVGEATLQGSVTNPTTLFAAPKLDKLREEGEYEYVLRKTPFVFAGRLIDEVNRGDSGTQNILIPMLDERREYVVNGMPIGSALDAYIGTVNVNGTGTYQISEQLADRFGVWIFLMPRYISNINLKDNKREQLEDILGSGEDEELCNRFLNAVEDGKLGEVRKKMKELRKEYAEKYNTISPDELNEIKHQINSIRKQLSSEIEKALFPVVYTSIYFTNANSHETGAKPYLGYVDLKNTSKRPEITIKKLIPSLIYLRGYDINNISEKEIESIVWELLPHVIAREISITQNGLDFLKQKYENEEISGRIYNSEEGKKWFMAKHVMDSLRRDYNRERDVLLNQLNQIMEQMRRNPNVQIDTRDMHIVIKEIVRDLQR